MFLSRNEKNNVYPCKPQFYYIKVGFKGVKIKYACFRDDLVEILHYENMPIQIIILTPKNENFQIKKTLIFFIFLLKT